MTGADHDHDRSHQGIDHWAQHGVEEYEQREAAERAERGQPDGDEPLPDQRASGPR
ncbi:hypothetical protein [Nakamurella multipartita]|jgi:hypothetical protein|uniref:Uncharacterized protein n=1 Tax=Nakamurella multipartita (strain ATCC 700099 / DSM 44233 / CIP 104796 / JCM 9543 / NBRC 105858 / Y-104) TaxID=479431 RepID=C8XEB2_NAKMY|nr:hypothetical protein [Nakamurella multipartita]ACV77770.1 hypothetical protein Namu_1367 [Nakamurella multipartita DSM 44233]